MTALPLSIRSQSANLGDVEKLSAADAGKIAFLVCRIGGYLNVGAIHDKQTVRAIETATAKLRGLGTEDLHYHLRTQQFSALLNESGSGSDVWPDAKIVRHLA